MNTRPFRILGVQQIALGHANKNALRSLWLDLLGLQYINSFQSVQENVDEDILSCGKGWGRCEIDLMQPLDAQRKPHVDQPALNHIGLWVDDLQQAVAWLSTQGVRFTPGGIRQGASGHDICFIHPHGDANSPIGGQGVLIELVQAPNELIAVYDNL